MKINQEPLPDTLYNERVDKETGAPIGIDMLVLHCSAYPKDQMIEVLKKEGVSAHYIIETDGQITQLVDEKFRAWHAGAGSWYGVQNINAHSIGIEIINATLGHMAPYPDKQIDSVMALSADIIRRYQIRPHHVIAHSDLAPTRKFDPGRLFPWPKLAKAGIGLYPDEQIPTSTPKDSVQQMLAQIGYPVDNEKAAIRAFLRHFMPDRIEDVESPKHDYFDFLWHYQENLPEVLAGQAEPNSVIKRRLKQVAELYQKSRKNYCSPER